MCYSLSCFEKEIVAVLKKSNIFEGKKPKTSTLNNLIADVARKNKLSVWARGVQVGGDQNNSHLSGHEWLYDLICYSYDDEHYALCSTDLVMESEWKGRRYTANDDKDPYGEVKFDFQKLLVSNAKTKLLVFKQHGKSNDQIELKNYFMRRIDKYCQCDGCSLYLFACFSSIRESNNLNLSVSAYRKGCEWENL